MCTLYLGAPNSFASTPPNPVWTNPSIQSSTYVFTQGQTYTIDVQLQNDDTNGGCSQALVTLFWSDPTTGFLILAAQQIPSAINPTYQPIGAATTIPPQDASVLFPFTWTPDATVAGTDGGHVCLLALAYSLSADCSAQPPCQPGQAAPLTNPQVALHNVHVNPASAGGGAGVPGHRPFFFGATNSGNSAGKTRLIARAYDPAIPADRAKLRHLSCLPGVRATLGTRLKFGLPAEVRLALGPESVVVPSAPGSHVPRLTFTGPLATKYAEEIVKASGGWAKSKAAASVAQDVDLFARQVRQAAVNVVPGKVDDEVYAVEVVHELQGKDKKPRILGGLTVLFGCC